MKKIATLFLVITCSIASLEAQTAGGPDAYGYTWRNSYDTAGPVYNWIDILPLPGVTQVRFLADDNTKGSFPIGFPFHYYWYDVTQFWVGSNGYVGFTSGQISHPFPVIPSTSGTQDYLAVMTSDLIFDVANSAECWRWTSADNDTCIVSFINVPFWDPSPPGWVGNNTFQVILSAVDSSITYQYQTQTGSPSLTTNYCSVGIENNAGDIGLQPIYNALPPSSFAIKFYYPSSTTYMVSDASTIYNDNSLTGGIFLSKDGNAFNMNTSVKNTGNQNLAPFNVFSRVINNAGTIMVADNKMTTALVPAQTENLAMTNVFNHNATGTFRFVTNTQLTGDATPSNDQKIQELVVVDTTTPAIRLSFDDGVEAGLGGLNWSGGNGGAAMYYIPPFYPCKLTDVYMYIAASSGAVGYSVQIYDDNGLGATAGTRLDSEFVAPSSIVPAAWNDLTLASPLTISSGGVYVAWIMEGAGLTLGQSQNPPFSNRTFEILSGSWADYRYRETEDLMINIGVIKTSTAGVEENGGDLPIGEFYPNPSAYSAALDYNFEAGSGKVSYELYDMQGRKVASAAVGEGLTNGKLVISTSALAPGLYSCRIIVGNKAVVRRVLVSR